MDAPRVPRWLIVVVAVIALVIVGAEIRGALGGGIAVPSVVVVAPPATIPPTPPPPTAALPAAKADSDLTGDDWVVLTPQGKAALVARMLGRVPYCHFTVAEGTNGLDEVYAAPETRTQTVAGIFASWLILAGCKKP